MNELKPEQKILDLIKNEPDNTKNLINGIDVIIRKINETSNQRIIELEKTQHEIQILKKELEELKKENQELKNNIENNLKEKNNFEIINESKNIKALKIHNNISEFNKYVKNLYHVNKWEIKAETYEKRAEVLSKYPYWAKLKNEFNNKNLTDKNLTNNQLVTYFDTMYLMYNLLDRINLLNIRNEMKIIQEYRIDAPNKPRIDYLLVFRNDLILLEFSKAQNIDSISKTLTEKQRQLEGYEKTLKNSLEDKEKYILTSIPIVYLSEETDKNKEKNYDAIQNAFKQINKALKNQKNAFEQLQNIE